MTRELIVYVQGDRNSEMVVPNKLKDFSKYFKHFIAETSEGFMNLKVQNNIQRYLNNEIDWAYFTAGGNSPRSALKIGGKYKHFLDQFRKINEHRSKINADPIEFVPTLGYKDEEETSKTILKTIKTIPRNGKTFLITKPWLVVFDFLGEREQRKYWDYSKFQHSLHFLRDMEDENVKLKYVGQPRPHVIAQMKVWRTEFLDSLEPKLLKKTRD